LLSPFPDAAAYVKKSDKLRRKTRNFHTGVAKFIEDGGGIYFYLL